MQMYHSLTQTGVDTVRNLSALTRALELARRHVGIAYKYSFRILFLGVVHFRGFGESMDWVSVFCPSPSDHNSVVRIV